MLNQYRNVTYGHHGISEANNLMNVSIGSDGTKSQYSTLGTPEESLDVRSCPRTLPFSISNILSPQFGQTSPEPVGSEQINFAAIFAAAAYAAASGHAGLQSSSLTQNMLDMINTKLTQNGTAQAPLSPSSNAPPLNLTTGLSVKTKDITSPDALLKSPGSQTTSSLGANSPAAPLENGRNGAKNLPWPAWVYCTRYSDRPSSGPRSRRPKRSKQSTSSDEKRPRTAFTPDQLQRLKCEFQENRYLTEKRRQDLANDLGLKESQIKIWFQNKRAKLKKQSSHRHPLALHLMAQGLYNHTGSTKGDESERGDVSMTELTSDDE